MLFIFASLERRDQEILGGVIIYGGAEGEIIECAEYLATFLGEIYLSSATDFVLSIFVR